MDYTGTLAILGYEGKRQNLKDKQKECERLETELAKIPIPTSEELEVAQTQKELVFHQLYVDLNDALFKLKVGDPIWLATPTRGLFTAVIITGWKVYADCSGTVQWKTSIDLGQQTFGAYSAHVEFQRSHTLFLPAQIRNYTPEQTQAVYQNVALITCQGDLRFY